MTCIIAVQGKNSILAADSSAYSRGIINSSGKHKIFRKERFLFGCTTSFRMIDLLQYSLVIPKHNKNYSDDKYIKSAIKISSTVKGPINIEYYYEN